MRTLITIVLFQLSVAQLSAQTITTIAGTGKPENNGNEGAATSINIGDPFGVEFASDGSLYICEVRNHRVWRMSPKGELTAVAGNGTKGYSGNSGAAIQAHLNEPYEVRIDPAGNILYVEMQN